MASAPSFASNNVRCSGVRVPATLDTSLTAPTNTTTVATGASTNSKIERVRLTPIASLTGPGFVNLFRYDGTTYHFLEGFLFVALTISATTFEPAPANPPALGAVWTGGIIDKPYEDLYLPSGWTLRCTCTAAPLQSNVDVMAELGDF